MEPIIGIDLGTTNSEVAFIIDESAVVIEDGDNGIVPSCVCVDDTGKVIVGTPARNQAILAPDRTVLSVKRLMGSEKKIPMGEQEYTPQEISAFILKELKERAEKKLKKPVNKAVITVPAYFTDAQRQATRDAGTLAGLEVARILNEPTAAALAYESESPDTKRILVFDLGGGTFDVSIVKIENGVVEVLSSTGDNKLGGDDFDEKLVKKLAEHCSGKLKLNPDKDPVLKARLKRVAENAKIALSSKPFTTIEEDHIGTRFGKPVHLNYEVSREDFEKMIMEYLDSTMDSVNKALSDADILVSSIDEIILVGGSTRIPAISNMLEEKFGMQPRGEIDPDLCVALGAAIQAGREMGIESTGVLLDITPYTFGTSAVGFLNDEFCPNLFVPIIRRNTKLPASRTEAFRTMIENQEMAEIQVYQGENKDALDNIRIATYRFNLSRLPSGSLILIRYDLDINGILKMEAVEKDTGKKINAVIENAFSGFSETDIQEGRDRIDGLWGSGREENPGLGSADVDENALPEELPPEIKDVLKLAREKLDSASEEDREEIVNLMEDISDAAGENHMDEAKALAEQLDDILFYIV